MEKVESTALQQIEPEVEEK